MQSCCKERHMQHDIRVAPINACPLPCGTSLLTSTNKPAPKPFPPAPSREARSSFTLQESLGRNLKSCSGQGHQYFCHHLLCTYKSLPTAPANRGVSQSRGRDLRAHRIGGVHSQSAEPFLPPSCSRNLLHDAHKHLSRANSAGSNMERALPA